MISFHIGMLWNNANLLQFRIRGGQRLVEEVIAYIMSLRKN
jgi:hypothetical protein